jgi:CheY-like chemotaxis protein
VILPLLVTARLPHILCVDDDAGNRRILRRLLERAGYAVTCVENGQEALDAIKRTPSLFEAVVTDHNMPVMTGLDLISQLLEMPFRGRIILSSATISPAALAEFEYKETIQILDKPVNPKALLAAVSSAESGAATRE